MMVHLCPRLLPVPGAKPPPSPWVNRSAPRLLVCAAWRGGGVTRVGISCVSKQKQVVLVITALHWEEIDQAEKQDS